LKALDKPDALKTLKELIESRLPKSDLADVLIDLDNWTNFLHHFLPPGGADAVTSRRDALAAVLAIGCNIGCRRMVLAPGLSFSRNQSPCRLISDRRDTQGGQHRHHQIRLASPY